MATHCPPTAVECGKAKPAQPSPDALGGFVGSPSAGSTCLHLRDTGDAGQSSFLTDGLPLPHPQQGPSFSG